MVKAFLVLTAAPYLDPFIELVHFEEKNLDSMLCAD